MMNKKITVYIHDEGQFVIEETQVRPDGTQQEIQTIYYGQEKKEQLFNTYKNLGYTITVKDWKDFKFTKI